MTWCWNNTHKEFKAIPELRTFRDALAHFKWYASPAAAQKAIEQGRIEYGQPEDIRAGRSKWRKVDSWKQAIPSGWPITIRRKSPYPSSIEICNSTPKMRRLVWNRIWNDKPIGWFWWYVSYLIQ